MTQKLIAIRCLWASRVTRNYFCGDAQSGRSRVDEKPLLRNSTEHLAM